MPYTKQMALDDLAEAKKKVASLERLVMSLNADYDELRNFTKAHIGPCSEPGCVGHQDHVDLGVTHMDRGHAVKDGGWERRHWMSTPLAFRRYRRDSWTGKILGEMTSSERAAYEARERRAP